MLDPRIVFSLNNLHHFWVKCVLTRLKIHVLELVLSEAIWEDRVAGIPMMWSYKS